MAKVVVTGGAGFIGSHLVDALIERGDEVYIIDTNIRYFHPQSKFHDSCDIRNTERMKYIMMGAEYVFHLAALPRVQFSIENPLVTQDVNVNGTACVLEAARLAGVKRVVFASSSSVYGMKEKMPLSEKDPAMPMSPYAAQKLMGEILCQTYYCTYGLETVCLRYFNVYGPGLDPEGPYALVIGVFLRQWLAGQPLTITGDGTQTRDFTHVSDVIHATLLASTSDRVGGGDIINIGAGRNVSVNELASIFGGPVVHIAPRNEPHDTRADNTLAKRLLGWEPRKKLLHGILDLKSEGRWKRLGQA